MASSGYLSSYSPRGSTYQLMVGGHNVVPLRASDTSISSSPGHVGGGGGGAIGVGGGGGGGGRPLYAQTATHYSTSATPPR